MVFLNNSYSRKRSNEDEEGMEDLKEEEEKKKKRSQRGRRGSGPTRSLWTDYQDAIFRVWLLWLPFVRLRRGAKRAAKSRGGCFWDTGWTRINRADSVWSTVCKGIPVNKVVYTGRYDVAKKRICIQSIAKTPWGYISHIDPVAEIKRKESEKSTTAR